MIPRTTKCPTRIGLLLVASVSALVCVAAGQAGSNLKHEYVNVNGVRLHYVTAGSGSLILFLHGFPEFWYAWKNQLGEFGRDHLAVAPDLRGYNLSEKPAELKAYEYSVLLEDIRQFADHFSPNRQFTLVGHDWGGVLAWRFAITHPNRLNRLVIINAPHPRVYARLLTSDPEQRSASQYVFANRGLQAEKTLSEHNYAALVSRILDPGLKSGAFTQEDKAAYLEAWSQPGALTGGLNYYRANRSGPPTPGQDTRLSASTVENDKLEGPSIVKVPTLVIWGEQDMRLLSKNLDGLEQFVPLLTVKRIADGSHWVVHEKPMQVNAYMRAFIR
jgi:pimeloyl-ACP methyl ester carboxylesterase